MVAVNNVLTKHKMTGFKLILQLECNEGVSHMELVRSLQRAIEYMENHLLDDIMNGA